MSYATIADWLQRVSAQDVAEAAAPDHADVDGQLLVALVDGADTDAYTAEAVTAGQAAIRRLERHLADATANINSYLQSRYAPLITTPDPRNADLLKRLCLDIASWDLLGGDTDSDRRHKHKSAMMMLRDIAAGVVALAVPADGSDAASGATFSGAAPMFGRDNLADA